MKSLLGNRNLALLLACCTVFGLVLSLTMLLVPLYGLTLSDSALILAVVVGVRPLAAVLLSLPMGVFGDFFGRTRYPTKTVWSIGDAATTPKMF